MKGGVGVSGDHLAASWPNSKRCTNHPPAWSWTPVLRHTDADIRRSHSSGRLEVRLRAAFFLGGRVVAGDAAEGSVGRIRVAGRHVQNEPAGAGRRGQNADGQKPLDFSGVML